VFFAPDAAPEQFRIGGLALQLFGCQGEDEGCSRASQVVVRRAEFVGERDDFQCGVYGLILMERFAGQSV